MCMNWFIFSYWFETFQVTAYPASSWWGRDFTAISQYNLQCIDKIFLHCGLLTYWSEQVKKVQKPVLSTILSGQSYSAMCKRDFSAISQYNLQCIDKIFLHCGLPTYLSYKLKKFKKPVLITILSGQSYSVVRKKFWIYVEMNFSRTTMTVITLDDRLSIT